MGRIKVGREKPRFYQPVGLMSASYYAEEARNVSSAPSPEPQPEVAVEPGKGEPQSGPEKKAPSRSRKVKK